MTDKPAESLEELNARLLDAYERKQPFRVTLDARPTYWLDQLGRYRPFSRALGKAPRVAGSMAVLAFVVPPNYQTEPATPLVLVDAEESILPQAFQLPDVLGTMAQAARYVGLEEGTPPAEQPGP